MKYTYDEYTHEQGTSKYKITPSGTAYHLETPDKLVQTLENLRESGTRVRLDYGDTITRNSWGDVYGTTGTIGRSNGRIKIPLLIHNKRSGGGGHILDNCIIAIEHANKKDGGTIYKLSNED